MKIKEIIQKALEKKDELYVSIYKFCEEFGFGYPNKDEHEDIKCYSIYTWMCTDSLVGYKLYTFKGQPCCITVQTGRKSDEHFYWSSKEKYDEVLKFCLQFIDSEDHHISLYDPESEEETIVRKM